MCLLVTGKASDLRNAFLSTHGMIEDVYRHNSDGLGFMYHTTTGVKVVKKLPKNAAAARKMFESLPNDDRMVAAHWRMRTHGDITLENCHPYPMGQGNWLMHNGVLHTGNHADKTKSDTWHFAKDFMSTLDADTLHHPQYLALLGEFIDSNRFVIMTADGRMSWVNEDQGVTAAGVTFSNTYAWSPEMLIPGYRTRSFGGYCTGGSKWAGMNLSNAWLDECDDDDFSAEELLASQVDETLANFDEAALMDLLETDKAAVIDHVLTGYTVTKYVRYDPQDNTVQTNAAVQAWINGHRAALKGMHPEHLANALMFSCDVEPVATPIGAPA